MSIIFNTHKIVVTLFLLIYLIKTILLLANSTEALKKFTKTFRIPEMIISFLFLATGVYMLIQLPEINMLMVIKLICVFASIPIAIIGFKKGNKMLAALSLLLILGAYGLAEMSKKKIARGNSEATANVGNDGKALYQVNCVKCHGEDGKAGIMGALDLSVTQLDAAAINDIINNGKGAMQPYKGILTDEQIKAVAEYMPSLKQ